MEEPTACPAAPAPPREGAYCLLKTSGRSELRLPRRERRYADATGDSGACGSARSATGPISWLRLSAELIKPTWL
jgi:hypothetical protein